jgi:hypothetical protein
MTGNTLMEQMFSGFAPKADMPKGALAALRLATIRLRAASHHAAKRMS